MNHALWKAAGARVIAMAFIVAGHTACGDRLANTHGKAPKPDAPSPSAVVIGTAPAQPTGDPPGTTPVASQTTEVTKSVESNSMPQPGQPNDHSNVAPMPSQKSGEIATTQAQGDAANAGERTK
jgi:hypothetical protein